MKLLLDTHAALWWAAGDGRLGAQARAELEDDANPVLLSAAVVWEIAIKRSRGKLRAPEDLVAVLTGVGAQALPITLDHAAATERLPPHHGDPFDRVLIAQAQLERATLVTGDTKLAPYGVPTVW